MYAINYALTFEPISDKEPDFRAKRITAYLNLIQEIVNKEFEEVKQSYFSASEELKKYYNLLSLYSTLKASFNQFISINTDKNAIQNWLNQNLYLGSSDVNVMTKVDKANYLNNEKLPTIYNDAHAALRGFAQSNLN
jgi:hypothetical protein